MLILLFTLLGIIIVLTAIISPFLALRYQRGRDSLFERLAEQHNLQFTKNAIRTYQALLSKTSLAARTMKGTVKGKDILMGDYVGSIFSWGSNLNFLNGWMQTRIYVNGQEQNLKLSPFWRLASERQIVSFFEKQ